jgi:DNA polymerase III epsilon subunit-like protein
LDDNHMMPICFVDTETTGLHQDKQLWEVAVIRRDFNVTTEYIDGTTGHQDMVEKRYEAFVPVDLSSADLFGLNVGKFYERHPLGCYLSGRAELTDRFGIPSMPSERQVAEKVARFTHGARFIGAAPSFDAEVLGDFLRKHGLLPTWHHRLIDTHDLAIGYLRGRALLDEEAGDLQKDWYSVKKDTLSEWLGIEPHTGDSVHTAMGDAQHEADIWDAVMG